MGSPISFTRMVRFETFEFDRHTLELRKHGLKIKISGQPMEVLAMLLAAPGELVTREDLQKRLWPNDTVVEFEHSINAAVKALRRALGDSADEPRFIETLPRRGYRFIFPVDSVAANHLPKVGALQGGAPADAGVVLVSAREGLTQQTPQQEATIPKGAPSPGAAASTDHGRISQLANGIND